MLQKVTRVIRSKHLSRRNYRHKWGSKSYKGKNWEKQADNDRCFLKCYFIITSHPHPGSSRYRQKQNLLKANFAILKLQNIINSLNRFLPLLKERVKDCHSDFCLQVTWLLTTSLLLFYFFSFQISRESAICISDTIYSV